MAQTIQLTLITLSLLGIPNTLLAKIPPRLALATGEQRIFKLNQSFRYSLDGPAVRVRLPEKGELNMLWIKAVKPGFSTLLFENQDGTQEQVRIDVAQENTSAIPWELVRSLEQLQEVEVVFRPNGVLIQGQITTLTEIETLRDLADRFSKLIQFKATLSGGLQNSVSHSIDSWLKTSPWAAAYEQKKIRIEIDPLFLWVRGSVESEAARAQLTQGIRKLYPLAQFQLELPTGGLKTAFFRAYLLEIKRSEMTRIGISSDSVGPQFRIGPLGFENLVNYEFTLNHLSETGKVRVLSNPQLSLKIPGEAELFSGGEMPIRQRTKSVDQIHWKNVGLNLKLKGLESGEEYLRFEIATEMNQIDQKLALDEVPGIQTNRMKTTVDAQFGTPVFLSGLLQSGIREQIKGFPILKDIPVLGALFSSRDFLNETSELVAVLIPHRAPPPAPMTVFDSKWPRGPVPAPRNWMSLEEIRQAENSPLYPWSAFP